MLKKMSDPALDETFVSSKPAFDGRLLHVHVDTVRLPNGRTTTREMADHQGAIAVVPILPDGSIIFVKQFRYPMGTVMYEIPAGKIDPGEEKTSVPCGNCRKKPGMRRTIGSIWVLLPRLRALLMK